eukprot:TRINITY_DN7614_c0_g1_i2.p1 TRINITY_DN7614_c0_g1~~TRINITY_DN7614_c0_g1_i2.p1  ORF type:complete len:354 (+),score=18.59 TRINITY_DN7614_c0_g1_i2:147-1208(+)
MEPANDRSPLLAGKTTSLFSFSSSMRRLLSSYSVSSMMRKQSYEPPSSSGSINDEETPVKGEATTLKRNLSIIDLMAYGLATTLGSGILVVVGRTAHFYSGPSVMISFLLSGFACLLSAFCYAEFAARMPISGSAYSFAYIALGEAIAWFVGWNLTLEYTISASAVAGGWNSYFVAALKSFGAHVPTWIEGTVVNKYIVITPFAALICLICTGILLLGMKESARFNIIITVVNIIVILFFIIAGSFWVEPTNWTPFFPYGFSGTLTGVGQVFFSYIGFDSVTTLAGECKRPKRNLPIGIIGTLIIVTVFYVAVSLVLTGMQPYDQIDQNYPLARAFQAMHQTSPSDSVALKFH